MKKTKSLLLLASILILGIFNLPLLNAANNRIEIVTKAKQYVFKNASGGSVGTLRQEIVEQDLVNGNLTVELTLDNSRNTEVFYIFNQSNSSTTVNNFKSLTESVFNSFGTEKTKIASILVSNELVTKPLKSTITEVAQGIDEIGSSTLSTGATLNSAVAAAKTSFTANANNKIIVIVDEKNTATNVMSSITEDLTGITVITYTTTTETLTNAVSVNSTTDALTAMTSTLIPAKNAMTIDMPFATYITNNFNISLVGEPKDATLDETTKTIKWNLGDVKTNEVKTLRYKLELKTAIDDSIIGLDLILNEAPTIFFNGIEVANTDANQCSPVIKVLAEAVDNPKTGIANYIIFGSTLLAVGGITYVIVSRKKVNI